jgi:hypothetical protein
MKNLRIYSVSLIVAAFQFVSFSQSIGDWGVGSGIPTFTEDALGVGISLPNGWQEIEYCNPSEAGLIITKDYCATVDFFNDSEEDQLVYDFIGGGINQLEVFNGSGSNEGTTLNLSLTAQFNTPINYLTGHSTTPGTPTYSTFKPLFWVRTADDFMSKKFDTKMIVMPDGSVGIGVNKPRAALDVRGSQVPNRPAAIIGSRARGTSQNTGPGGLSQYYTQQVQFVPYLKDDGFNKISQDGDQGIFFSDGFANDGANQSSSLVIAPWANPANSNSVGGLRIDASGNLSVHGWLQATEVVINAKWWSDFVFAEDYKLPSLAVVEQFIAKNKHLPNVPSEADVLKNGINVTDMQAIQMQKIEELTLYMIQMKKDLNMLQNENIKLKAEVAKLTH